MNRETAQPSLDIRYMRVKGKALTMVREFLKVYPEVSYNKCMKRIAIEVQFSMREEFGKDYNHRDTQKLCDEVKETIIHEF